MGRTGWFGRHHTIATGHTALSDPSTLVGSVPLEAPFVDYGSGVVAIDFHGSNS